MYKKLFIGILICLLVISPIAAENWNSFAGGTDHNAYREDTSDFVTNLWTFNMESPIHSSPAIYKDFLYVASTQGILKAIDMETGEEDWDIDLEGETNSSPVINSNKLFIGTEDGIKAINTNTHEVIWDYDCDDVESTPVVYKDVVYFGSNDGHLYGLDEDDGKVVLNKKLDGELKSSPIVVDKNIYIGSTNGKLYSIGTDKDKNWEFTTGDAILSSPSFINDTIVFGSDTTTSYLVNPTGVAVFIIVEPSVSVDVAVIIFICASSEIFSISKIYSTSVT